MKAKLLIVILFITAQMPVTHAEQIFGAPVLVSQQKVNCDVPSVRCDGVTAIFNAPFNPDYDAEKMIGLSLRVGSMAVRINNGQENISIAGLGFDRNLTAQIVYQRAEGCCWKTFTGASLSFTTLNMEGKLIEPTPVPTPTVIVAPVIETMTVTNTTPETITTTQNTGPVNNVSESTTITTSPSPTPTTSTSSTTVISTPTNNDLAGLLLVLKSLIAWFQTYFGIKL